MNSDQKDKKSWFSHFLSKKDIGPSVIAAFISGMFLVASTLINHQLNKQPDPPKPHINVRCSIIHSSVSGESSVQGIYLNTAKKASDELYVVIQNDGDVSSGSLDVAIESLIGRIFSDPNLNYEPLMLKKFYRERRKDPSSLQYTFLRFGKKSVFTIRVSLASRVFEKDLSVSVLAFEEWWPASFASPSPEALRSVVKSGSSSLKVSKNTWNFVTNAYASDMPSASAQNAIYLGGYDPIKLMNDTFLLLQSVGIVNPLEAKEIKLTVEESQGSVMLAGVNIPKFHELIVNLMLSKGLITKEEGIAIIERSRKASGVLINGYNPIHFNAELLGVLVQKKIVDQSVAQKVMDDASMKFDNR